MKKIRIITTAVLCILLVSGCALSQNEITGADSASGASVTSSAGDSSEITSSSSGESDETADSSAEAEPTIDTAEATVDSSVTEDTEASSVQETSVISDADEAEAEEISLEPEVISWNDSWEFAGNSVIHTGTATLYKASANRKDIVVGLNAGHGTQGGNNYQTYCHPDQSAKVTGGSTSAGSVTATAVSSGMTFSDGTSESSVTLQEALILKDLLLAEGYDVLMIRESEDVQLDNIARTVICNNNADCHIAIHWDGDGLDYDKGCFYMAVPEALKTMYPVSEIWQEDNRLGDSLISGISQNGIAVFGSGSMEMDLTQTSYSTIPSVDIELGNQSSDHSTETLTALAIALKDGVNIYFGY